MRTLGAAPTTSDHLGYFVLGTVNTLPSSGGIIGSITLPVTGSYIVIVALNFGNAGGTNSLYLNVNSVGGQTFYGGTPMILGGGFAAINTTLFFANTGSQTYNMILTYNGTPGLININYITGLRVG